VPEPEADRVAMIRQRLERALSPEQLEIIDDSRQHAGHAGSGGGGHFSVWIVSEKFRDQPVIQRHRMVYLAVNDMMPEKIHALSIKALAPGET